MISHVVFLYDLFFRAASGIENPQERMAVLPYSRLDLMEFYDKNQKVLRQEKRIAKVIQKLFH